MGLVWNWQQVKMKKKEKKSLKEVCENWGTIVREGDRGDLEAENSVVWEKSRKLECESAGVGGVTGGSARQWYTFEEQFAQVVSAIYLFFCFFYW